MNFRRQPVRPTRIALLLRGFQIFFLVLGIAALGYCAFVMSDGFLFQAYQTWKFDRALKNAQAASRGADGSQPALSPDEVNRARAVSYGINGQAGAPLGRIEISSVGIVAMIMEGVDNRTLRHAVGHVPGTPFPGEQGNVALSAHRDTFFRPLRNIHKDDQITLTTLHGTYRYAVDTTQIVEPDNATPLAATDDSVLTLITCYPFYFVGPAPKRFIVRAHLLQG